MHVSTPSKKLIEKKKDFDRKTRAIVETKIFNKKSTIALKNMVSLAKLLKT
jgi:hypothetical protein